MDNRSGCQIITDCSQTYPPLVSEEFQDLDVCYIVSAGGAEVREEQ